MFKLNQPLGLPKGTVRGVIAIVLTLTFAILALKSKIEAKDVVAVFMMALGFYFGSRNNQSPSQ